MKKKIGDLAYWSIFILILTVSLFSFFSNRKEAMLSIDNVSLASLYLCGVSQNSESNIQIDICGNLISEKEPAPLRIYIYRMPEKKLVAENQTDDMFSSGQFLRRFTLPSGDAERYKVVVYLYREIIDEAEINIQE